MAVTAARSFRLAAAGAQLTVTSAPAMSPQGPLAAAMTAWISGQMCDKVNGGPEACGFPGECTSQQRRRRRAASETRILGPRPESEPRGATPSCASGPVLGRRVPARPGSCGPRRGRLGAGGAVFPAVRERGRFREKASGGEEGA